MSTAGGERDGAYIQKTNFSYGKLVYLHEGFLLQSVHDDRGNG